ncbi:MAG: hypothetical protein HFJ06_03770 [Lachnospiraceae bacterium]|nr:hypothetical protein [Lachnospiraceae bacterium]
MERKKILQLAVTATSEDDIEIKLQFLENEIVKLEKDWQEQEAIMAKREYFA